MKPSERIWLQAGTGSWDITGDVTWNEEKINDNDIEYVRSDYVALLEAKLTAIECGECTLTMLECECDDLGGDE